MTTPNEDAQFDLFGSVTFPCPGWRVLDAVRSQRFTGELTCATIPATKVYLDAGQIYFAERQTDPSLGARLVDSGALSATQLELGSMVVGSIAHLGRLFERVASVDRQQVMLVTELMTDDRVAWLASRLVAGVELAPYRHHPTGIRRWSWPPQPPGPTAVDALPPPPTGGAPAVSDAPDPTPPAPAAPVPAQSLPDLGSTTESYDDGMIRWDQPSWLDLGGAAGAPTAEAPDASPDAAAVQLPPPAPPTPAASPVEQPERTQAEAPATPIVDVAGPPPGADPEPIDRFEVIWPSGEVDEQVELPVDGERGDPFGAVEQAEPYRSPLHVEAATGNSVDFTTDNQSPSPLPSRKAWIAPSVETDESVAIAVRRAVATIDTGSLDVRRRFVATPTADDPSRGAKPTGSMAAPSAEWVRRAPTRSVFDEPSESIAESAPAADVDVELVPDDTDERVGALRRLIDSMRRG